ncbi:hypothetical protein [Frigidibacter sp. ROC022]|uniref:hypothetical protein n=1 Tax=Frigidibacter sp. ROC022 TaxID=2971796 RepID=UPI00215A85DF|nr:hypothetical protein [Frigidibacter sp. ROC022]MCR8723812.1 hypothetical protein [Frigidibacter sp. ROC022]
MDGLRRGLLPVGIAAVVVAGFAWLGGTAALGAHPWWAVKVGWLGAMIGAALALALLALQLRPGLLAGLGLVALAGAGAVTFIGKTRFAASYAEDALAGQMWFFGWIAVMAGAVVALAGVAALLARR